MNPGPLDDSGSAAVAETSDFLVLVRREGTIPPASKVGTLMFAFFTDGLLLVVRRVGGD